MNINERNFVPFKEPIVYEKSFVVYSFNKDLTIEDINEALKDMHVSARELKDDEVIYHI